MTSHLEAEEHTLYRFWNKDLLLYVGISINAFARAKQHSTNSKWFQDADRVDFEKFSSRSAVEAAEIKAIREEHPLYNVRHNTYGVYSPPSLEELDDKYISVCDECEDETPFLYRFHFPQFARDSASFLGCSRDMNVCVDCWYQLHGLCHQLATEPSLVTELQVAK